MEGAKMDPRHNVLGQPIGFALEDWKPSRKPERQSMEGRFCRLEPLSRAAHLSALHAAFSADREGRIWTYLPYGPFDRESDLGDWVDAMAAQDDPLFFAIIEAASGRALGVASYLRITPNVGCIEVGHINFAPALQRSAAASEAMFLMMARVFDELGYRRYEWKCDALNEASQRAAKRLGFVFEGIFRQATIYKGRNRDTAWYSIIDREWPALKRAFETWLAPENFDADGSQKQSLGILTAHR
jgi:RimJ/RimL family protein N-acetyltransferase